MIREDIQALVEGVSLSSSQSKQAMEEIMCGQATNAQIGAFLTALRIKGETVDELVSFAEVMRKHCQQIHPKVAGRLVDTCGTGGDRQKTFNVSTAAAFVIAGAGVAVAKQGNRSVTSSSGSADVLENLGVNLKMPAATVERCIESVGVGFMFAPAFHPAMRYAVAPRKEVGIRTAFNLLGPLTNPAGADAQLLGVYDAKLVKPVACSLGRLGCTEAFVVHGLGGMDEVSTVDETVIAHLKDGGIAVQKTQPEDFGLKKATTEALTGGCPEANGETLFKILTGYCVENDPKTDIVLANAALGLVLGAKATGFIEGVNIARESIRTGAAYKKLRELVKYSEGNISKLEELEQRYA